MTDENISNIFLAENDTSYSIGLLGVTIDDPQHLYSLRHLDSLRLLEIERRILGIEAALERSGISLKDSE